MWYASFVVNGSWLWCKCHKVAVTVFIAADGGGVAVDMYARTHDPISYISPERAQAALSNLPVPVGMFMNMAHVPPRFYNQHQQALQGKFFMKYCIWISKVRCSLMVLKNKCGQDVLWNSSHNCCSVSYSILGCWITECLPGTLFSLNVVMCIS